MTDKSAQNRQSGFFSFDTPNLPTFRAAARQHRTATLIFFLSGYSLIVLSLIAVIVINQNLGARAPVRASQNLPLNTAYGSQRHVFTQADGRVIAIYLNQNKQIVAATSQDEGVSWQEGAQPLVTEAVENVAGAQDKEGNLHLVYEGKREMAYRKVSTQAEPWSVSEKVVLDKSSLGHRPTVILDKDTQLPAVAWASEQRGTPVRGTQILFLAAKGEPTNLGNWCNGQRTACGGQAVYLIKGSADILGAQPSFSIYHPVLAQLPQNGDLYLWWSNMFPSGRGYLEMVIAKKEGNIWRWGEVSQEDEVGEETAKNFTLTGFSDSINNRVLVVYVGKDRKTKVVAYGSGGEKTESGSLGEIEDQFSLTGADGKYYLFYRSLDGHVGIRKYGSGWSGEVWQSPQAGGYPSAPSVFFSTKLPFIYVTPENKVILTSYDLIPPTPTATPTLKPTPTISPSPTLEPSLETTLTPTTELITPTLIPTPTSEVTPTATPT